MRRLPPLALALVVLAVLPLLAASRCSDLQTLSVVVHTPGYVEPNTPGAPGVAAPAKVQQLLGADVDLNTITTVRTVGRRSNGQPFGPPKAILILIPGFLGGAATFAPLASELVRDADGDLEVWAVDRRPNQLEDRRGSFHAQQEGPQNLVEGVQFYSPDQDLPPLVGIGGAAGPEDFDINGNGIIDPPFTLPDASGGSSSFLRMEQDDVRFMAHWGLDTYARDWKMLVDAARNVVGPEGLVLFGGHSQGTTWASLFAAYDFDPGPGVDAAYEKIDGLVLLEGGGAGPPSGSALPLADYQAAIANLETAGGPDVYLASLFGLIDIVSLGAGAELSGIAGVEDPTGPSLLQRTPFGATLGLLIPTPATNRSIVGFFLDDDFSSQPAFRASLGFSDDGTNTWNETVGIYQTQDAGFAREWKDAGDPTLPTCPPNVVDVSPGCAILDNGPKPAPGSTPAVWGQEVEVTPIDSILRLQYTNGNFAEWYFMSGRLGIDFAYGRDASALGDESLLAVTQNANVDVPVLAIGGSNGLTPTEDSFGGYLGSIATPPADQRIEIVEGYAHLDLLTARNNATVPLVLDWIDGLLAP